MHTAFQPENLRERLNAVCEDGTHVKNCLDEVGLDSTEWINLAQDSATESHSEHG